MNRCSLLFAALCCACIGVSAQQRVVPVDEAASVPDFFSFRAQLQTAIAKRDTAFVLGALNKEVKLSFGGDAGVEDFKRMWNPSAPDTHLWEVLAGTLALGGTFAPDGTFTAPYLFTKWPKEKDAFSHMAAIGSGVRVRGAPTTAAPVVATLDFSIAELIEQPSADARWIRVVVAPGKSGFVDARFLRSPLDYRVNFEKLEGRWQVMFFLAGD